MSKHSDIKLHNRFQVLGELSDCVGNADASAHDRVTQVFNGKSTHKVVTGKMSCKNKVSDVENNTITMDSEVQVHSSDSKDICQVVGEKISCKIMTVLIIPVLIVLYTLLKWVQIMSRK